MTLGYMDVHIATLFRLDGAGRIEAVNQVGGPPAPRVFLGRTLDGNVYCVHRDLPADLASELEAILATEPVPNDLRQPPVTLRALHDALDAHSPVEQIWQGPAWRFPERITQPGDIETTIVTDAALVRRWFPWLADEIAAGIENSLPCAAVAQRGDAVSVCFCSRTTPQASEAGVETVEAFRGRGYATASVAAWARAIRDAGRDPLYSTSWDNHASRAVARRLGLVLYGADLHIT